MTREDERVDDAELAEIVTNLRAIGADVADIEVKRAETALPKSVRETLSAFANTAGGILILGLDEKSGFSPTGVTNPAKLSADLASLCSEEMEPPLRPLMKVHEFEGAQLIVVEVPALDRSQRPGFYRGAGIGKGSYIRVGDGDRRLTSYEVQMMMASRGQPREDEAVVPGASIADFEQSAVTALVDRLRKTRPRAFAGLDDPAVLRRAKVLTADGGVTLAGLLAVGNDPQAFMPQLMISFVHYATETGRSTDGTRFLDNVSIEGPVPVMVEDALNVLRRNMSRRAVVSGAGREDVWEYPETALREAIVNALAHRDYSTASLGTQVQIEMYPNRLVIRNPGGLFGPVSIDMLGEEGLSSSRNTVLLKLLEDVELPNSPHTVCENRGSGIRAMLDDLRMAGMTLPHFDDRVSSFTVTFPNHALISAETIAWLSGLNQSGLSETQRIGLAVFRGRADFDNRAYREATGVDSRIATTELQDLVARELVDQAGSRRWTRYQVRDDAGSPRQRADRRQKILAVMGDDSMTSSELAAVTGLSPQAVRHWLRRLRKEGSVELIGNVRSRNARYRRNKQNPLFEP